MSALESDSEPVCITDLSAGDEVTIDYRGTHNPPGRELDKTLTATVDSVDYSETEGHYFGTAVLQVYVHDGDEEANFCRRRLKFTAGSWKLQTRYTTQYGVRWQRIHQPCDIEVRC